MLNAVAPIVTSSITGNIDIVKTRTSATLDLANSRAYWIKLGMTARSRLGRTLRLANQSQFWSISWKPKSEAISNLCIRSHLRKDHPIERTSFSLSSGFSKSRSFSSSTTASSRISRSIFDDFMVTFKEIRSGDRVILLDHDG
ncbi:unnamed protein product [Rhizophagus irregularis]|nr:unnamed protein product [Rhizophagus irregularis]